MLNSFYRRPGQVCLQDVGRRLGVKETKALQETRTEERA